MRIRFEKRLTPSRFMQIATPVASVLLTMLLGAIIFQLIGFDGPRAIYETFITPIVASYKWQDVLTKAAPLIIIALGLSLGNQAKIWNIGAEGQREGDARARERADDVLALRADVPDLGLIAEREPQRDDDERGRLRRDVLPFVRGDYGRDEGFVDRARPVEADQLEDDRAERHG